LSASTNWIGDQFQHTGLANSGCIPLLLPGLRYFSKVFPKVNPETNS